MDKCAFMMTWPNLKAVILADFLAGANKQVRELIFRRANFDSNDRIHETYEKHRAKIRAISRLTGGNPRFILMLYEVLSFGDIDSCVQTLRQLVDELTPLLKDILEHQLTDQQTKVIDAMMRAGGVSTPRAIATATRLPLNAVTTQLQRLKKIQIVDVRGGGKGRTAYYHVADQLFRTWYQMRFLRPHRRRIEMFVEVLRIWFEEEQRLNTLRALTVQPGKANAKAARNVALAVEYVGASLAGTAHESAARDLVVDQWMNIGEVQEAAMALAEFNDRQATDRRSYETSAYIELGEWALDRGSLSSALESLRSAVELNPNDDEAWYHFGSALLQAENFSEAIRIYNHVIKINNLSHSLRASTLIGRGAASGIQGDIENTIRDCNTVLKLENVCINQIVEALYNRGIAKGIQGNIEGEIEDHSAVIELKNSPVKYIACALINRGIAKGKKGDLEGVIEDCSEWHFLKLQHIVKIKVRITNASLVGCGHPKATSSYPQEASHGSK